MFSYFPRKKIVNLKYVDQIRLFTVGNKTMGSTLTLGKR